MVVRAATDHQAPILRVYGGGLRGSAFFEAFRGGLRRDVGTRDLGLGSTGPRDFGYSVSRTNATVATVSTQLNISDSLDRHRRCNRIKIAEGRRWSTGPS